MFLLRTIVPGAALLLACSGAAAQSLLVSDSGGVLGYGYGYSGWSHFNDEINSRFSAVNRVANLENLTQVLSYDSLMVDQRWTSGSLSALEVANITAFIATGKRVLMFGDNSSWTNWNNQILGIVGGSFDAELGTVNLSVLHPDPILTAGVSMVQPAAPGTALGGTSIFSQNVVTLWGAGNVLTILDINIIGTSFDWAVDNRRFGANTAQWLAIPTPGTVMLLVGAGLAARRRR